MVYGDKVFMFVNTVAQTRGGSGYLSILAKLRTIMNVVLSGLIDLVDGLRALRRIDILISCSKSAALVRALLTKMCLGVGNVRSPGT